MNRLRLFKSPAYLEREEVGLRLQLSGREWELWWPFEVLFDWLHVPLEDRAKARAFYRGSIPSTKAELPEKERGVLEALRRIASDTTGPLVVRSDELTKKASSPGNYMTASEVGRILKNLGLIEDKDRIQVEGKKLTQWIINREKLQKLCERWRITDESD